MQTKERNHIKKFSSVWLLCHLVLVVFFIAFNQISNIETRWMKRRKKKKRAEPNKKGKIWHLSWRGEKSSKNYNVIQWLMEFKMLLKWTSFFLFTYIYVNRIVFYFILPLLASHSTSTATFLFSNLFCVRWILMWTSN